MVLFVQKWQDSAQWHMTAHMCTLLEEFKWKIFEHSPHSPRLVPSIIYSSHLNKILPIQSLRSNQETKDIVQDWLTGLTVAIFSKGIHRGSHSATIYVETMWKSSLLQAPTYGSKDNFQKFCKSSLDQISSNFLDTLRTNPTTAERD